MKTSTLSRFLFSLFFFVFAIKYSPVSAADTKPVRDIKGKDLRAGVHYYIVPIIRGAGGGGVTIGNNRNGTFCQLDVVQERFFSDNGTPVKLTPVDPKKGIIRESTDLNIEFNAEVTICMRSLVWQLADFDEATKQYFVTTRGVKGNPGLETLNNWFKIERLDEILEGVYKLVFCPNVCDFCKPLCKDIGIYFDEDGARRLALLSDEVERPFGIVFRKKEDETLINQNGSDNEY